MKVAPTAQERARAEEYVDRNWRGLGPGFVAFGGHDPRRAAVDGYLAELVVARVIGAERVGRDGPDGGVDLLWRGRTVQVKWNHWPRGDLYSRPDLPVVADLHVLVVPDPAGGLRIAGYLPRVEYLRRRAPRTYGRGNVVLAVPQDALHPVGDLVPLRHRGDLDGRHQLDEPADPHPPVPPPRLPRPDR